MWVNVCRRNVCMNLLSADVILNRMPKCVEEIHQMCWKDCEACLISKVLRNSVSRIRTGDVGVATSWQGWKIKFAY